MQRKPIRIVHVIARMNVGGPAILISELLKGMNSGEFESKLVTGYCEKNEIDFIEANSLDLKEKRIAGLGRSISIYGDIKAFYKLTVYLRQLKPDIVHTHTAKAGFIGRIATMLFLPRVKRIHTFHGHLLSGYFSSGKTKILIFAEKFLAYFTELIFTVGNQVKMDLLRAGIGKEENMIVSFPGINAESRKDRITTRKEVSISDSEVILIFVGRLTKIKRPDRLIEAFRIASEDINNMTLLVVGDGELRDQLERQAFGLKIKFLGWRTDVNDLIAASDISILTSDNEGMPITLIESAHLGIPSISTDVGSVKDVVIHSKTGYLTPLDESVIAERIKQLAISPSLRLKFGSAAREHAQLHFSVAAMIKTHADAYKSVIER